MGEIYEHRPSFSSLNPPMIRHRLSSASIYSPEHPSGISTPPLQMSASVPFKWEQEPGKPLPGAGTVAGPKSARFLDPPPCRIQPTMDGAAKTPSPSSILDGPYNVGRPKFSSSRFSRDGPEPSDLVAGRKSTGRRILGKVRGGQREVLDGGSLGFSSSSNSSFESGEEGNVSKRMERKLRRHNSFSSASHGKSSSHVWKISKRLLYAKVLNTLCIGRLVRKHTNKAKTEEATLSLTSRASIVKFTELCKEDLCNINTF
ncbi:hypothetical protein STAS_12961 [Striga asiatica]|uniref:Uncharacterized protein n=1 Tax=Striga asiatica TaxID=4170 RepID=A0A5A7PVB2_STRAF|nr:hypothetical protein STAS_12961 [Striga asiatica]